MCLQTSTSISTDWLLVFLARFGENNTLAILTDVSRKPANYLILSEVDLERVRPYVASLKETLATAPLATQRAILQSFIKGIEGGKGEICIEFAIPRPDARSDGNLAPVLGTVNAGTPEGT